jgi:hypothetical protein
MGKEVKKRKHELLLHNAYKYANMTRNKDETEYVQLSRIIKNGLIFIHNQCLEIYLPGKHMQPL